MTIVRLPDQEPGSNARRFEGEEHGAGLSFFLVDSPPGAGPALHRHPTQEVFVVQEGQARFFVGDDELDAGAGDVVIVPPEAAHRFVNGGAGRLRLVAIQAAPRLETESL
jgi:mannose-6-phosphate isomerase-like protein (cupin superfamily)